jgi:hypothetical protein
MTDKQSDPELTPDVRDLAREYRELCRLRAELERCYHPKKSRPGHRQAGAHPAPQVQRKRWVDASRGCRRDLKPCST